MKSYFSNNTEEYMDFGDPAERESTFKYRAHVFTHFASLHGAVMDYYGADSASSQFKVDGLVFRVLEDPDDGYRSHLGAIEYGDQSTSIFFRSPIAKVRIEIYEGLSNNNSEWNELSDERREGYQLIDVEDGHVWLEFGTNNTDDYYPCFTFIHYPKEVVNK